MLGNRYREGMQNICKKIRATSRMFAAEVAEEKNETDEKVLLIMDNVLNLVLGWVIDEINDADADVKAGRGKND